MLMTTSSGSVFLFLIYCHSVSIAVNALSKIEIIGSLPGSWVPWLVHIHIVHSVVTQNLKDWWSESENSVPVNDLNNLFPIVLPWHCNKLHETSVGRLVDLPVKNWSLPLVVLSDCCFVTGGTDCESYRDGSNIYHPLQTCWVGFCCGDCYNRYCCSDSFWRLTEDQQDEWYSPFWFNILISWSVGLNICSPVVFVCNLPTQHVTSCCNSSDFSYLCF